MKRQILIVLIISAILLARPELFEIKDVSASPSGWLYPWKYRRRIWINGANYNLTDYQMVIKFYWSRGFTGYLANSSEDFNDIRFTAADGVTVIPHWKLCERAFYSLGPGHYLTKIEIYFLVKIPYIPTNGTWIYVYYGNPISDESTSNASAVLDNYVNNFTDWNYEDGVIFHPDGSVEADSDELGEPYGRAWTTTYLPPDLEHFRVFFKVSGGSAGWSAVTRAGLVASNGTEVFGIEYNLPDIREYYAFFHYIYLRSDAGKLYKEDLSFATDMGFGGIYSLAWCNETKTAKFGFYPGTPYYAYANFTFDFCDVAGFGIVAYPEDANIRLYELGFAKFPPDGVEPTQGRYGVEESTVTGYGDAYFSVQVEDIEGEVIDYLPVNITVIRCNTTTGEYFESYSGIVFTGFLFFDRMNYSDYDLRAYYHNIKISPSRTEAPIYITLDNTTVGFTRTLYGSVWRLRDYRVRNGTKLKRVYIWDSNYTLSLEDNSPIAPLSNVTVILSEIPAGGGVWFGSPFALAIYYGEERPTKVEVVSNATEYSFYWDGNTLIIEGDTGNATVVNINITEYYRLTVEVYDTLGNRLSTGIYLNNTLYRGRLNLTLPVAIYRLTVPSTWKGYKLAKIEGSESEFLLDDEKEIKIYYKVPTEIDLSASEEAPIFDIYHLFTQKLSVEGVLKDVYGNPIRGAEIIVKSKEWTFKTITDNEGRFRISNLEVLRGEEYSFTVKYEGDETYVGTQETISTTVSTNWLLLLLLILMTVIIIITIIMTLLRRGKEIIREEKSYKYVEEGEYKYVE